MGKHSLDYYAVSTVMRNLYKTTEEEFALTVKSSLSIRECLLKLGLAPAGGNYQCFHKRVKELGLSTDHFIDPRQWNKGRQFNPKRPISDYLNNLFSIQSHALRIRLIKEGLKEPKCECCGIAEWNGKAAPLELDHIDGDRKNNNLSNLRILCPNCHAQTETYRGKNKGKIKPIGDGTCLENS